MQKALVETGIAMWGFILLLTFIVYVFEFFNVIPMNVDLPIRIIFMVIEVVGFVIASLGLLLQEK